MGHTNAPVMPAGGKGAPTGHGRRTTYDAPLPEPLRNVFRKGLNRSTPGQQRGQPVTPGKDEGDGWQASSRKYLVAPEPDGTAAVWFSGRQGSNGAHVSGPGGGAHSRGGRAGRRDPTRRRRPAGRAGVGRCPGLERRGPRTPRSASARLHGRCHPSAAPVRTPCHVGVGSCEERTWYTGLAKNSSGRSSGTRTAPATSPRRAGRPAGFRRPRPTDWLR